MWLTARSSTCCAWWAHLAVKHAQTRILHAHTNVLPLALGPMTSADTLLPSLTTRSTKSRRPSSCRSRHGRKGMVSRATEAKDRGAGACAGCWLLVLAAFSRGRGVWWGGCAQLRTTPVQRPVRKSIAVCASVIGPWGCAGCGRWRWRWRGCGWVSREGEGALADGIAGAAAGCPAVRLWLSGEGGRSTVLAWSPSCWSSRSRRGAASASQAGLRAGMHEKGLSRVTDDSASSTLSLMEGNLHKK